MQAVANFNPILAATFDKEILLQHVAVCEKDESIHRLEGNHVEIHFHEWITMNYLRSPTVSPNASLAISLRLSMDGWWVEWFWSDEKKKQTCLESLATNGWVNTATQRKWESCQQESNLWMIKMFQLFLLDNIQMAKKRSVSVMEKGRGFCLSLKGVVFMCFQGKKTCTKYQLNVVRCGAHLFVVIGPSFGNTHTTWFFP